MSLPEWLRAIGVAYLVLASIPCWVVAIGACWSAIKGGDEVDFVSSVVAVVVLVVSALLLDWLAVVVAS